jgi:hypothetical protein
VDPATIAFRRTTPDLLKMHGGIAPRTAADPMTEGFGILLSNADGVIYRAFLRPGDLAGKSTTYMWFLDRAARSGRGVRGGIFRLGVRQRGGRYFFTLQAYADLAGATLPMMTAQILVGDDVFINKSEWKRTSQGWQTDFHFPFDS